MPSSDFSAYSISSFCKDHNIGRTFFYQLQKEGKGPKVIRLGGRRLISAEAALKWRQDLENLSSDKGE